MKHFLFCATTFTIFGACGALSHPQCSVALALFVGTTIGVPTAAAFTYLMDRNY